MLAATTGEWMPLRLLALCRSEQTEFGSTCSLAGLVERRRNWFDVFDAHFHTHCLHDHVDIKNETISTCLPEKNPFEACQASRYNSNPVAGFHKWVGLGVNSCQGRFKCFDHFCWQRSRDTAEAYQTHYAWDLQNAQLFPELNPDEYIARKNGQMDFNFAAIPPLAN